MVFTFHLDFNPHEADHRRAADWLAAQPDATKAIVRLVKVVNEGKQRLLQWEELATLLANEVRELQSQLSGQPLTAEPQPEIQEDQESAQRLDSMFG